MTVEDVTHSMRLLSEEGRPPHRGQIDGVTMEAVGERGVRFTFAEPDWEAPLILALRPVLKKTDV